MMKRRFSKDQIVELVGRTGILPLLYHDDDALVARIVEQCYNCGIRAFEFTNRGPMAADVFAKLLSARKERFPEMALGVGTIMTEDQCEQFVELGADFIVAPIVDPFVGDMCMEVKMPWIPGTGTLSEVIKARELGAELIKIFPGNVLGPGFIKAVLGPCPYLKLMPTGGVDVTHENLNGWFDAGAFCVGVGSKLFPKDMLMAEQASKLKATISTMVEMVDGLRKA